MENDLKLDLISVLELNESNLNICNEPSHIQLTIITEIRSRLLKALNKANSFFDNNLELLTTISQLKREIVNNQTNFQQIEETLKGRISCLTDIVQRQQNEIEVHERMLRLKGIWGNLLKTTSLTPISSYNDECSLVITWLSLQCARDANQPIYGINTKHWEKPPEFGINQLLETIQSLYNVSEEKTFQLTKENTDLRKVLNENEAKRQNLLRQYNNSQEIIQKTQMEIEDWRSKSCLLYSNYYNLEKQVKNHEITVKNLEKELSEQKINCSSWRQKCHELLDAIDAISAIPDNNNDNNWKVQEIIYQDNQKNNYLVERNTSPRRKLFTDEENKIDKTNIRSLTSPRRSKSPKSFKQSSSSSSSVLFKKDRNTRNEVKKINISHKTQFYSETLLSPTEPNENQKFSKFDNNNKVNSVKIISPSKFQQTFGNSPISSKELDENSERLISSVSGTPLIHKQNNNNNYDNNNNSTDLYELDLSNNMKMDYLENNERISLSRDIERGRSKNRSRSQSKSRSSSENSNISPPPIREEIIQKKQQKLSNLNKKLSFKERNTFKQNQENKSKNKIIELKSHSINVSPSIKSKESINRNKNDIISQKSIHNNNNNNTPTKWNPYFGQINSSSQPSTPKTPSIYDIAKQITKQSSNNNNNNYSNSNNNKEISPIYPNKQQIQYGSKIRSSYDSHGTIGSELPEVPIELAYNLKQHFNENNLVQIVDSN